jgi:AraC-like DNA-binding protein
MTCLDVRYADLDRERSRMAVLAWIDRYGDRLRGIVSADDASTMEGVKRALSERGRSDIICVANGATRRGFELVKDGTLKAITYQSPELEGMLAIRTAADWFSGIAVEPIRYLPAVILTDADADSFLAGNRGFESSPADLLCRILSEARIDELNGFFEDLHRRIAESPAMSLDYFRGLIIEMVAGLLNMAKTCEVDGVALLGGYETLYRGLAVRHNPAEALDWVRERSVALLDLLVSRGTPSSSLVDRLISYTELHYADPLALKTIAERFGLSASYLGKLFRERTGNSYSRFLNELRIRKARSLLRSGQLKTGEVARAVGYADSGYFAQVFRRIVGVAPNQYAAGTPDRHDRP